MFASEEWASSTYASKFDGDLVRGIILEDSRFWRSLTYYCSCVSSLVKVLRLVDGDSKPSMGYIYEAMDRERSKLQKNFKMWRADIRKCGKLLTNVGTINSIDLFMLLDTILILGNNFY